jgi:DNA-binding PadR family transcriptional regulator
LCLARHDDLFYNAEMRIRGELETAVLVGLAHLGDGTYGVPLRAEVEQRLQRSVSVGALYTTLDRLQHKGLISSWTGASSPVRGGRAKRHFRLEPAGRAALEAARRQALLVWSLEPQTEA